MSLSHDHYMRYISFQTLEETLTFNSKGNYVINKINRHATRLHQIPDKEIAAMAGNELLLNILETDTTLHPEQLAPLPPEHPLHRNESCTHFSQRAIDFSLIQALAAPIVRKHDHAYKRGYPSGGALYPVEVFFVNLNHDSNSWPGSCDVLHLLPNSRNFEVHSPDINMADVTSAILPLDQEIGAPSAALIFLAYLPKALFKYKQRGYRLAAMEAGSMYMLVDLQCKALNLRSRPWSGFTDYQVTQALNLNPGLFIPLCVQFIG